MATTPEELLDEWADALLAHDPDRLAACYAEDARLYVPSAGVDAMGRAEVRGAFAAMLDSGVRPTEFTVQERSVVRDGDHAYAHLTAHYTVGSGPDAVSVPVRATEVMARRDDGTWLYVIDHA